MPLSLNKTRRPAHGETQGGASAHQRPPSAREEAGSVNWRRSASSTRRTRSRNASGCANSSCDPPAAPRYVFFGKNEKKTMEENFFACGAPRVVGWLSWVWTFRLTDTLWPCIRRHGACAGVQILCGDFFRSQQEISRTSATKVASTRGARKATPGTSPWNRVSPEHCCGEGVMRVHPSFLTHRVAGLENR